MATIATINDLPLDEGLFRWPLYRGTVPQMVRIHGFGPKWEEYKAMVSTLQGAPAKIALRGTHTPGGEEGVTRQEIAEVFVVRATRINEVAVELECFDSRLLLNRAVGDMDFNMTFGDGFLSGTEFTTYKDAIVAYCGRFDFITSRLASDAFNEIPDVKLEQNAHLSAMVSGDPLGYLTDRAGCDLVVGLDGKWYFASLKDATSSWFAGYEDYNWLARPGFLALETVVMQRPKTIISYYWERHCIRAEGVDPQSTASTYGPVETQVELTQVYLYEGEYFLLSELLEEIGLSGATITDAQIAAAFLSDSAQGSPLHPVDTFQRKVAWAVIRRDWRRLWRIDFPSGNTGGWDDWQFGKLNADGSVDPVGVECPYVEFKRVVSSGNGQSIEGQPWTFNREAPAPFKAIWDDGPESGVLRIVPTEDALDELMPPMPGELRVERGANPSALPTDALVIAAKNELDNSEGYTGTIRNLTLFGREDISKGRFVTSFSIFIYLVARRFMPNDKTRWHLESADGFSDGDIPQVELPPGVEVTCYRTFVGGDAPDAESDGLGAILNPTELADDAKRRADVWKVTHSLSAEGHGRADTLELSKVARLVDGPVVSAAIVVDGVETYTEMTVGNLADDKQRARTARKREAARKVKVQGVPVV